MNISNQKGWQGPITKTVLSHAGIKVSAAGEPQIVRWLQNQWHSGVGWFDLIACWDLLMIFPPFPHTLQVYGAIKIWNKSSHQCSSDHHDYEPFRGYLTHPDDISPPRVLVCHSTLSLAPPVLGVRPGRRNLKAICFCYFPTRVTIQLMLFRVGSLGFSGYLWLIYAKGYTGIYPRDPIPETENSFMKPKSYASQKWLDIPCSSSENMTVDAYGVGSWGDHLSKETDR